MQNFLVKFRGWQWLVLVAVGLIAGPLLAEEKPAKPAPPAKKITGRDVVQQCEYKYPGEDQQSQLSITLIDKSDKKRKTIYLRLWKDMKGKDNILDKMVLFTLYPADARGTAFMRWAYKPESGKHAEQWIYLPTLRKIRRVSVRDLSDSFLGSDLTYGDISYRGIDEDDHKLVRIDQDPQGNQYFVVESTPREANPQYAKKVSWYRKTPDLENCVKRRVNYYDKKGIFLKQQDLKWQKVNNAWVWDEVFVQNAQTRHKSHFKVEKVKINKGVNEEWFTERRMRIGLK